MKERKPYDRLIADKLQRLPAPDADASWQKMKQLLDAEDNKPGGGMKRPGNGWWGAAFLALLFMSAIWTYTEYKKPASGELASNNLAQKQLSNPSTTDNSTINLKNKNTASDNTSTLNTQPAPNNNNSSNSLQNGQSVKVSNNIKSNSSNETAVVKKEITISENEEKLRNSAGLIGPDKLDVKNNVEFKTNTPTTNLPHLNNIIAGSPAAIANYKSPINANATGSKHFTVKHKKGKNNSTEREEVPLLNNEVLAASLKENIHLGAYIKNNKKDKNQQQLQKNDLVANSARKGINTNKDKREGFQLDDLALLPAAYGTTNTSLAITDSIDKKKDFNNFLSKYARNLSTRALNEKEALALDKKIKRGFRLDLSNTFKPFSLKVDAEPWWAAGLALNYTVPVSGQSRFNYNLNAKSGMLSDYIPSPYVQFHLNDFVYFQTEINLSSPQFTPRLLLYQTSNSQTGIASLLEDKTIYAQKLYYFNWPISMHYSPVNNLFLAAGIQFSSFQSGLASIQTRRYMASSPNNSISNDNAIVKFKDDSLAAKLNPTEWRWQLGVDYAIKRFSVGLRYNKSFKDLLNLSMPNSHDIISTRNASLIFSIRYNLFDSKDRTEAAGKSNISQ
jgi:hypothetical protein